MVLIKLIISFFIILTSVKASELSKEETTYFKIIDLNNDSFVSIDEINQSMGIIFQLIDINKDNKISLLELEELKKIIEILK
jgi:Ca2+-binding EF-hand superfamily protein